MRSVWLASTGVFAAAITAVLVSAAPEAEPTEPPSPPVAAEVADADPVEPLRLRVTRVVPTAAAPRAPVAATPPVPPVPPTPPAMRVQSSTQSPQASRSDESQSGRRWRRSRRNRYPGPIPTPSEWRPPDGPVRIALQAGHWRADEAPRELSGLRGNGTSWRNTPEWEANLAIVRSAAAMLEDLGYTVDVLPAVVPPGYRAHLFISIHADGSNDPNASGYRVAAPRSDATGRASRAVELLQQSYGKATGIKRLPTVTRRMQNYYAFNYRRYEHALHPMTIGVILETGFLTSAADRRVILDAPERAARGIVDAVVAFPETPPPTRQAEPSGR